MSYYGFRPYVPVAKRREQAAREMAKLAKKGRVISPVAIEGRLIASTFWGKAWCENLERYSDYASRLPRGRTYVRNGSVVDLQIERGRVRATVSGSELYTITIEIGLLPKPRWEAICRDCLGSVGSLVELLQGKLSKNVMERVCRADDGLFPSPGEIKLRCSCPDWADMCKHVSAALYGVGARLDAKPDLLFELRGVDRSQLISSAGKDLPMTQRPVNGERVLAEDDVAALFGIEMEAGAVEAEPAKAAAKDAAEKRAPGAVRRAKTAKSTSAAPPGAAERGAATKTAKPGAGPLLRPKAAVPTRPAPSAAEAPKIAAAAASPNGTNGRRVRRVHILRRPKKSRSKADLG